MVIVKQISVTVISYHLPSQGATAYHYVQNSRIYCNTFITILSTYFFFYLNFSTKLFTHQKTIISCPALNKIFFLDIFSFLVYYNNNKSSAKQAVAPIVVFKKTPLPWKYWRCFLIFYFKIRILISAYGIFWIPYNRTQQHLLQYLLKYKYL